MKNEKTKITITHPDGTAKTMDGDTVIAFVISDADKFVEGKATEVNSKIAFMGKEIPDSIFHLVIGPMLASFIKVRCEESIVMASLDMDMIGKHLMRESKKIMDEITPEEIAKNLHGQLDRLFETMWGSGRREK